MVQIIIWGEWGLRRLKALTIVACMFATARHNPLLDGLAAAADLRALSGLRLLRLSRPWA
ncbi:hypothetical protein EBE87_15840 [Pseudoroseomonas wenyumeiae]|uniref:Uncharacterized protein n=1 Tax=Teichococcus wenyumeiae TaxID=2478470 RepID=A0A3A9JY54_9PROT|nr:hypothetical protein D6Z83_11640 [Pseudoroseomonas wenyumeiae]RMI19397.1 hypothetical protein EBE87_20590 [Pseudoroseomonas wenyumeiae]RMI20292.1 hypothetical protein EBE87_15840 [Pseudoroseomonas wenyumeiae]